MKTFKSFMVEGPSDLAPNPDIVKAIKKDKEEAKRRKQEMIATREKNLKNYQQGKVRANWVKEEVEQIEESYTLKLTKTTKPHTTDDEDNPVPAIEKHYDIHHKGKKVGEITHHYNEYGGHFFDANLHGKRVPYDRHPGKEQNAKAFIAGISKTKWHSKNIKEEVDQIDEVAAWQRSEGKNPEGGLNKKGIQSYRREHPGSKLSLAVTTKPSKLKKGSKAWNRRKSFCARMSGMKRRLTSAKTAHDPDSRINKSLRKWNC